MRAKTAPRVTPLTVCWIRTSCHSILTGGERRRSSPRPPHHLGHARGADAAPRARASSRTGGKRRRSSPGPSDHPDHARGADAAPRVAASSRTGGSDAAPPLGPPTTLIMRAAPTLRPAWPPVLELGEATPLLPWALRPPWSC